MHRHIIITFALIIYFVVATVGLSVFGGGLIATLLSLFVIPIYTLARFSAAPSQLIATVACFALGLTLILEGVGYFAGLWLLSSYTGALLFGWLSLDVLLISVVKTVFLVLFYELLFDDGNYSVNQLRRNLAEFGLFALAAVVAVSAHLWLFDTLSLPSAYYWLSVILVASSVAMILVHRTLSAQLLQKITTFVAVAAIPLLCIEYLLIANDLKVITEPLHLVGLPFTDVALPLAEVLLALSVPIFVTSIYEMYLDDAV